MPDKKKHISKKHANAIIKACDSALRNLKNFRITGKVPSGALVFSIPAPAPKTAKISDKEMQQMVALAKEADREAETGKRSKRFKTFTLKAPKGKCPRCWGLGTVTRFDGCCGVDRIPCPVCKKRRAASSGGRG